MRWTIYRQELVLFHPRHKLLRFIQEQDSHVPQEGHGHRDFYRYRRHAQKILETLHKALSSFPKGPFPPGAEISFKQFSVTDRSAEQVTLDFKVPTGLDSAVVTACLEYCDTVLHAEAWPKESPPRELIEKLQSQLRAGNTEVRLSGLEKSTLLQLISVLPILPHWDLMGVFSENSEKNITLLSGIRRVEAPVYAAQVRYLPKQADCDAPSPSVNLLDYQVRLRACYCDASRDISSTIFVREDDYYAYCHYPNGDETPLYRAYGVLFDALQAPLAEAEHSSSNEQNLEARDVFYIAYPIKTALGRTHFWHFYLSPERSGGTLDELWKSWWPLHQRILDWPYLHASLAAELEQLDIGYVQEAILHDLNEARRSDSMASLDVSKLVCSQGHVLFPAYCFCTDKVRWLYERYVHPVLNDLGHIWKQVDRMSAEDACAEDCTTVGGIRFKTKTCEPFGSIANSNLRPLLLKQRYERLVEQQQFLAGEMVFAMEKKQRLEERKQEDWKRSIRRALLAMNVATRNNLRTTIGELTAKLDDVHIVEVEGEKFSASSLIKKWHGGKDINDRDARRELLLLISLNAHAMVSEFLELNPIKVLTHSSRLTLLKDWDKARCIEQIKMFQYSIPSLPEVLLQATVKDEAVESLHTYKSVLEDFCKTATNHLQQITQKLDTTNVRCKPLDETKEQKLQIVLNNNKLNIKDKWINGGNVTDALSDKRFSQLRKLRLSLPSTYLYNILELSAKVATFNDDLPKLNFFRLPWHVEGEDHSGSRPAMMFRNYFVFQWQGDAAIVDSTPDGSIAEGTRDQLSGNLRRLSEKLKDIGRCFVGKGIPSLAFRELDAGTLTQDLSMSSDIWPEINANEVAKVLEHLDHPAEVAAVKNALNNTANILMVVFESWYWEGAAALTSNCVEGPQ